MLDNILTGVGAGRGDFTVEAGAGAGAEAGAEARAGVGAGAGVGGVARWGRGGLFNLGEAAGATGETTSPRDSPTGRMA